ncbi:MAG: hypothetical protein OEY01_12125 [Desulfobulbaceae bacterium]|nr:hypothetical protein [Desulfobulbaceae bacterium]HIJ79554.1 hypothetical protein [Deltaproteobacteria bacterium]
MTDWYLNALLGQNEFFFNELKVTGIDNSAVFKEHGPQLAVEEDALHHKKYPSGDEYLSSVQEYIEDSVKRSLPAPVVRFADGEYAFYRQSLGCNGLYKQAESVEAIQSALPLHVQSFYKLLAKGKMAPLIHPGNTVVPKKSILNFFKKPKGDDSALLFTQFLAENKIALTHESYIPFYIVYAYLTSSSFLRFVNDKHICILNSTCDTEACERWFRKQGSNPKISFVPIPDSYLATQWPKFREEILAKIPDDIDLCLVGAGIGSLLVCVDVAEERQIPAIDGGHVLNMMNSRKDKSKGNRLYTIWGK